MAYPRVENMGLPMYFVYFVLYMASIEFGVYWMHRGLHDIKWGYRCVCGSAAVLLAPGHVGPPASGAHSACGTLRASARPGARCPALLTLPRPPLLPPRRLLHSEHHKYNKEHTLSPFAGLAFHPLDGILQAVPYTLTLFFCPMHFLTHEILLFFTGVWTTNIHDNLHAKVRARAAREARVCACRAPPEPPLAMCTHTHASCATSRVRGPATSALPARVRRRFSPSWAPATTASTTPPTSTTTATTSCSWTRCTAQC